MLSIRVVTILLAVCSLFQAAQAQTAEGSIHGTVVDQQTGRSIPAFTAVLSNGLEKHELSGSQQFQMGDLPGGPYILQVTAPGFTAARAEFQLTEGERKEFQVVMAPQAARRSEVVEVHAVLGTEAADAPGGTVTSVSGRELLNLSTVVADDPLRAVQSLPGIASDNDFEAKFSLRGQDFGRVGIYMDGVKLPNPLHSFEGSGLSGSASFFNRAMVDELTLYDAPYPERFQDSSAGALDVSLRDGSSDGYHFLAEANFAQASFNAEGPFGPAKACSWNAGFRKTYLQYVLAGRLPDPSLLFGVQDEDGRTTCHLNSKNTVSLDLVDSYTSIDQSSARKTLSPTALLTANQHTNVFSAGWMFTPTDKILVNTHAAYLRDTYGEKDAANVPLGNGNSSERSLYSNAEWFPDTHVGLSGGLNLQTMDATGNTQQVYSISNYTVRNSFDGKGTLLGGFLQQTFAAAAGRIRGAVSERWDHDSLDKITRFSPAASLSVRIVPAAEIQLGWGRYVQFPDLSNIGSVLGNPRLLPLQSTQMSAGLALRLGENTTVRATYYHRNDRNLADQPFADPRLLNGVVFFPATSPLYTNSLSGTGHGYEFTLQRRTVNRVSGFISYSYGHTVLNDSATGQSYPSDWDQRSTVTSYIDYSWRTNVDVSGRYMYGSGFPVPGYVSENGGHFYFASLRNAVRLPDFQSLNLRVNKTFPHEAWRMKLYAELVNATDHNNEAWGGITGFTSNPAARLQVSKLSQFPILPSLGLVFEF